MHAPFEPAFRVEWRRLVDLADIAAEWRALAARALEPNVFYEPEFALAAAPAFGCDVSVLLVWSVSGPLVGLFPSLQDRRRYGLRGLRAGWTHPYAPLGVPLVDRDHAPRVISGWLDHLSREAGPGLLLLPMLARGAFAASLHSVLLEKGTKSRQFDRHRRAMLAPGGRRADYLQHAVSVKRRKEIRRLRHRLEDIGPVSHVVARSHEDIGPAVDEFLRIEAGGWKGEAGTAASLRSETRAFLTEAVCGLAAAGKARADLLLVNGKAVAAAISLCSGETAWTWKIAYDEGFARYSPGVQLLLEVTRDMLAGASPARVDSCAVPDHPMIDAIWRERLEMFDLLVAVKQQFDIGFRVACGAEAARRKLVALAKAALRRMGR
jgi:CelD/BcsL family acetyltransferase involved in cellulose biosynthesis